LVCLTDLLRRNGESSELIAFIAQLGRQGISNFPYARRVGCGELFVAIAILTPIERKE
jgi:hypothetical protein